MEPALEALEVRAGKRMGVFPLALLFLAIVLWVGWLAALLKAFNAPAVTAISLAATLAAWWLVKIPPAPYFDIRPGRDRLFFWLALALIAAVFVTGFWLFHDSFGYRDEALYSNNAIYLSDHGNLPYPTLNGSDSRLFLNTVWDAELYGLLGVAGLRLTNVVTACLALVCVYMLVRELSGDYWPALLSLLLIVLSYPFAWFMRRTVNEIFFFSLCWICFYLLYRCLNPRPGFKLDLALLMLIAPLPAFVRVEGLIVLGVCMAAAVYIYFRRSPRTAFPTALFVFLLVIMVLSAAGGYYHLEKKYGETISGGGSGGTGTAPSVPAENTLRRNQANYSFWVMLKFGILPALLMIPIFFALLFMEKKSRTFAVFLLLATLPFFYFFLKPSIFFDLPWLLRRFVAVVTPLAFVSFSMVVFRMRRSQAIAVATALLVLTVVIALPVLPLRDHGGTVTLGEEVARQLPEGMTVLVDRYILGDYSLSSILRNINGIDNLEVNPWKRLDRDSLNGADEVYLVTNQDNFFKYYGQGGSVFDASVAVEGVSIIYETDADIRYLQSTGELHRGGYENTWLSMDYRVALSQASVPTKVVDQDFRILVVSIRTDGGGG